MRTVLFAAATLFGASPAVASPVLFEVLTYCRSFPYQVCEPDFDLPAPVPFGASETYGGYPGIRGFGSFSFSAPTWIDAVQATVAHSLLPHGVPFATIWNATTTTFPFDPPFPPLVIVKPDLSGPIFTVEPVPGQSSVTFSGRAAGSGYHFYEHRHVLSQPFLAQPSVMYYLSIDALWEIGFGGHPIMPIHARWPRATVSNSCSRAWPSRSRARPFPNRRRYPCWRSAR